MEPAPRSPDDATRYRLIALGGDPEDHETLRALVEAARSVDLALLPPSAAPEPGAVDAVVAFSGSEPPAVVIDRARQAVAGDKGVAIVVVGDVDDEPSACAALEAGASAYLCRAELGTRLLVTTLRGAVAAQRGQARIAELERESRLLATRDGLTSLANRELFHDRLTRALAAARRNGQRMAVLFLDLDNFKLVNDSLGHAAGDRLLQTVASIISSCLRESDTAARLGGDEFGVLLTHLGEEIDADRIAQKILAAIGRPISIHRRSVYCSVSIGIATVPGNGDEADDLLRKADTAMYHAKARGRNRSEFFTEAMNDLVMRRATLETALRTATTDGGLEVHYQPVFDLRRARLVGAEALIRWHHADLGPLPPDEFLPLAEESGLIHEVGDWVLQTACEQAAAWRGQGHDGFRIAVNVSPRQLEDPRFRDTVERALLRSGLPAQHLEIEITERDLVLDDGVMVRALHELKEIGVHLSVDDFGTGYSALSYLKDLPFDLLKIDRTFVSSLLGDPAGATIVEAIVRMAQGLNLTTVAEGVEAHDQLMLLGAYGCHRVQGYLFGAAVSAPEFARWIEDPRVDWEARETD
jgi:diguanylate cyclase (GGDEF)-like protein